jgi:aerobic-type carbon monoxide dehydrogenase small subunit (CoxS/CutS family)
MNDSQFVRLAERERPRLTIHLDGRPLEACLGDTVLTALLLNGRVLRLSEFGDGARAGFCLMGACQDCWVFLENGRRIRACTTMAREGLRLATTLPGEAAP